MVLLTDGKQLFLKHRIQEKGQIAEALTGRKAGQYVWAYAIGSLIEEVDRIVCNREISLYDIVTHESYLVGKAAVPGYFLFILSWWVEPFNGHVNHDESNGDYHKSGNDPVNVHGDPPLATLRW